MDDLQGFTLCDLFKILVVTFDFKIKACQYKILP